MLGVGVVGVWVVHWGCVQLCFSGVKLAYTTRMHHNTWYMHNICTHHKQPQQHSSEGGKVRLGVHTVDSKAQALVVALSQTLFHTMHHVAHHTRKPHAKHPRIHHHDTSGGGHGGDGGGGSDGSEGVFSQVPKKTKPPLEVRLRQLPVQV